MTTQPITLIGSRVRRGMTAGLFILAFTLPIATMQAAGTAGQTFTVGQYNYTVLADVSTVAVTGPAVTPIANPTIPGSVSFGGNTYTVTAIADAAFYETGIYLTGNLTLPPSLQTIGDDAFWGEMYLTAIDFGQNSRLESIGANAFNNTTSLLTLTLPPSLRSIGDGAFEVSGIQNIDFGINSSLETIGEGAFFASKLNCELHLPPSLQTIGIMAFALTNIRGTLQIPPSVTEIGDIAFYNCFNLDAVVFYRVPAPVLSSPIFIRYDGSQYYPEPLLYFPANAGYEDQLDHVVKPNFNLYANGGVAGIQTFSINGSLGLIDEANHTVTVYLSPETDIAALTPGVVYSGSSISPAPGTVVDFSGGSVTYTVNGSSGSVAYTVSVAKGILVTQQPQTISALQGGAAAISCTALGEDLQYQWQNGLVFLNDIPGAFNEVESIDCSSAGTWLYRCKISSGSQTVYTNSVPVAVSPPLTVDVDWDGNAATLEQQAEDAVAATVNAFPQIVGTLRLNNTGLTTLTPELGTAICTLYAYRAAWPALTTLDLGGCINVSVISQSAFAGFNGNVILPPNYTKIETNAFARSTMTWLELPVSDSQMVDQDAFSSCTYLKNILITGKTTHKLDCFANSGSNCRMLYPSGNPEPDLTGFSGRVFTYYTYSTPADSVVAPGDQVTLNMSINEVSTPAGTVDLSYQWTLNGAALNNDTQYAGVTSSSLTIKSIKDAGCYALQYTYSGTKMTLPGVWLRFSATAPAAPQNLSAGVSVGQVQLFWLAPADNGGSAITGYQVSNDGGATWTNAGLVTNYTFTGLTGGTAYRFAVRAANAQGAGTAATVSATPATKTVSVGAPKGTLKERMSGAVTVVVTTANIAAGATITLNNINAVAGVSMDAATTTGNSTSVMIRTTVYTPHGVFPLSLTIDGVTSDTFYITVDEAADPLTFTYSPSYDIPASIAGTPITDIDVSGGVSGGTSPYSFSATGLPDGITISAAGMISGTPVMAGAAGTAMIKVTDSATPSQATTSILINYGEVTFPPVYGLSIGTFAGGSVSAAQTGYEEGETATLIVTPDTGYELDAISACKTGDATTTVSLQSAGSLQYTFTMPDYGVTVAATFKKTADQSAVETAKSLIEGSSYTVSQAEANTAAAVKSWLATQINALAGMSATGITVTAANITTTTFSAAVAGTAGTPAGTNGSFSFTVSLTKGGSSATTASKSGTITATPYTPPNTYLVTINSLVNGNVSVNPATPSAAGTQITLTISPDTGYELNTISAYKTGDVATSIVLNVPNVTTRTFTMPNYSVTVAATFKKTADQTAVETAKNAIESASYALAQTTANTEADIKSWIVSQINTLIASTGITVSTSNITISNFKAAVAGTSGTPAGTNGAFSFTVSLTKGGSSLTTAGKSGTITATPYTPPNTYLVTINSLVNGNVSVNPATPSAAGTQITLTISPNTGYELNTISAYKTGDAATTIVLNVPNVTTRTFTMPNYGVTVAATFKKTADQSAIETAKSLIEGSSYTVSQTEANTAAAVKSWLATQINALAGMSATGITVTAANITTTTFSTAVAGISGTPAGTNGSFSFTVSLTKGGSSLTTAGKSGTITATPYTPPNTYLVTINSLVNGNVSVNPATPSAAGTQITLTISPNAGYELNTISAYKTSDATTTVVLNVPNATTRTFTMPNYSVTIAATFKKTADQSTIETAKSAIENSSYTLAQTTANTEATVKSWIVSQINTLIASTGITVSATNITISNFKAAVAGTSGTPAGTNGSFSFTVSLTKGGSSLTTAGKSGTITATPYTPPNTYLVTINSLVNGNVTVNPATPSAAGTQITLTISPDTGYELNTISAYKTGDAATTIVLNVPTVTTRTFTMPNYGVTIAATFKKTQAESDKEAVESLKAAVEGVEGGTFKIAQATGNDAESVKTWIANTLNLLFGQTNGAQFRSTANPIIGDVTMTAITPAIAGTDANPDGINGSFKFTVTLTLGTTALTTIPTDGVIIATPEKIFTGIENPQTNPLAAWINDGILHVNGLTVGKPWYVYDISGRLIYHEIATDVAETRTITSLHIQGIYIIQSGEKAIKIIR